MSDFISRVQMVLKELNMTQGELSEKLGVRRENFTYWKANKSFPNVDIFLNMAKILNVDARWLAFGDYTNSNFNLTREEQDYLNKFKQLTERDKKVVSSLCDILLNEKALSSCREGQEPNLEKN